MINTLELKKIKGNIDLLSLSLYAGFIAFTFGLLINALYIDVFEASKVAYVFLALTGVVLALAANKLSGKTKQN